MLNTSEVIDKLSKYIGCIVAPCDKVLGSFDKSTRGVLSSIMINDTHIIGVLTDNAKFMICNIGAFIDHIYEWSDRSGSWYSVVSDNHKYAGVLHLFKVYRSDHD